MVCRNPERRVHNSDAQHRDSFHLELLMIRPMGLAAPRTLS
jgi:hypothetical protein